MTKSNQQGPTMHSPEMDVFLNRWFTAYEGAKASLDAEGGYLFPYGNHFFITVAEAVRELGLDPDDPDWERIGWDWVRPKDPEAWERLRDKRQTAP